MANNQNQNQNQGERGGSGNFKNDPQRASEAGRKGGERSRNQQQGNNRSRNE